jgi:hypothetical protein
VTSQAKRITQLGRGGIDPPYRVLGSITRFAERSAIGAAVAAIAAQVVLQALLYRSQASNGLRIRTRRGITLATDVAKGQEVSPAGRSSVKIIEDRSMQQAPSRWVSHPGACTNSGP